MKKTILFLALVLGGYALFGRGPYNPPSGGGGSGGGGIEAETDPIASTSKVGVAVFAASNTAHQSNIDLLNAATNDIRTRVAASNAVLQAQINATYPASNPSNYVSATTNLQSGTATIAAPTNTVTFSVPFASAPSVLVGYCADYGSVSSFDVLTRTVTNFTYLARDGLGIVTNGTICWIATTGNGVATTTAASYGTNTLRIYRTTDTNTTDGVPLYIPFNAEIEDTMGAHDTVTNPEQVQPKENGFYILGASAFFAANSTGNRTLELEINGVAIPSSGRAASALSPNFAALVVDTGMRLTTNDTIRVIATQTSGGTLAIVAYTNLPNFWMVKVAN